MNEAEYLMKNYGDQGGWYPSRKKTKKTNETNTSIHQVT